MGNRLTAKQVETVAKALWEEAPDTHGDWDRLPVEWCEDVRKVARQALADVTEGRAGQ